MKYRSIKSGKRRQKKMMEHLEKRINTFRKQIQEIENALAGLANEQNRLSTMRLKMMGGIEALQEQIDEEKKRVEEEKKRLEEERAAANGEKSNILEFPIQPN